MIDQETLGASLAYTNKALEALKNVVHYLGVTTTTLSDGATTNPITINGTSVTAVNGDMVFYNGTAYTWDGTEWQETLSIAQIITQIETITEEIGNLSNLTTEEKSNLVGAINEIVADIPKNLSDLQDDATHRTVSDTEKSTWNGKADTADITNAINALDVSSVGGTGKYISKISEADGKINATARIIDNVPIAGSPDPVSGGGIKTYVDNAIKDSMSLKTATGNPITLTDAANANAEELSMTIEPIQSGSGDPSPTNVRPISGLTEGKVIRTGKNLLDLSSKTTATTLGITFTVNKNDEGEVTSINVNGTSTGTVDFICPITTLKAGTQYILNGGVAGSAGDYKLQVMYGEYNTDAATSMGGDANFTVLPDVDYKMRIRVYSGKTVNNLTFYPMIRLSTITDPTFEPYTGATATITLGQTVYGGSVNFKTGEVTVTHGMVDLGTLNWTTSVLQGVTRMVSEEITNIKHGSNNAYIANAICSIYTVTAVNFLYLTTYDKKFGVDVYGRIYVLDTAYTDAAAFKTAMSGVQLCYELATPTTLTLTPAELELLKGNNTITANGAEISIEYYPDNAIGALAEKVDDKADKEDVDNIKAVKVTDTFSASPTRLGAYVHTSGSTVDITSFVSNEGWECWIFPVVPGDSFVITVVGGIVPRAYCFIDENGNVLSRADEAVRLTQTLITADKKGFCIIQNLVETLAVPSIVGTLTVPNSAYAKTEYLSAQIDKVGTAEATRLKSVLPSAVGWYRFARYIRSTNHAGVEGAGGQTVNFQISRVYRNTSNESYSISFASARSKYIFRVINAAVNEQLITKLRYVTDSNTDTFGYLEFYYASNIANDIDVVLDRNIDYDLVDITQNTGSPIVLSEFDLTGARNSASGTVLTDESGATKTYVDNKVKKLATRTIKYISTSTDLEYTGVNVSCPTGHTYIVCAKCDWDNGYTQSIAASDSSTDVSTWRRFAYGDSAYITFMLNEGETAYIWGKWSVAGENRVHLSITDITI